MKRFAILILTATLGVLVYSQVPASFVKSGIIFGPAAQGGSGLVLIEEHTASTSAELDFTTCISATYDDYQINLLNVLPATAAQPLFLQMSTNGGSTYDTGSNYSWANNQAAGGGGGATNGSGGDIGIILGPGQQPTSATDGGLSGHFGFTNPANAAGYKMVTGQSYALDSRDETFAVRNTGGTYLSSTAVNAFRLIFASGNITSGTARCYGFSH